MLSQEIKQVVHQALTEAMQELKTPTDQQVVDFLANKIVDYLKKEYDFDQ